MPSSANATMYVVNVPFSEAAIHLGLAGMTLLAIEEDQFVNGKSIPVRERLGCYVNGHPLAKAEAGWPYVSAGDMRKFLICSTLEPGNPEMKVERIWLADDSDHAREQHKDAFGDSEPILFVRELVR